MYKISDKVLNFISKATENWKLDLVVGRKTLVKTKIQRSIFHRDSLSLLLFVKMMSLIIYLENTRGRQI